MSEELAAPGSIISVLCSAGGGAPARAATGTCRQAGALQLVCEGRKRPVKSE